eukprot:3171438-Rhodomonas_salina.1
MPSRCGGRAGRRGPEGARRAAYPPHRPPSCPDAWSCAAHSSALRSALPGGRSGVPVAVALEWFPAFSLSPTNGVLRLAAACQRPALSTTAPAPTS